jgi:hypothetical protein
VPRRIPADETAGRCGGGHSQDAQPVGWPALAGAPLLATFLGFPLWLLVFSDDLPHHLQSASHRWLLEVPVHGSGQDPCAATTCAVNGGGDAWGCRYLLGGVNMTLTRLSSSSTRGNPRSGLLNRAAAVSPRHSPLEGAALAASGEPDAAARDVGDVCVDCYMGSPRHSVRQRECYTSSSSSRALPFHPPTL